VPQGQRNRYRGQDDSREGQASENDDTAAPVPDSHIVYDQPNGRKRQCGRGNVSAADFPSSGGHRIERAYYAPMPVGTRRVSGTMLFHLIS